MISNHPTFSLGRLFRKFFVSGFVITTFLAYVLHERLVGGGAVSEALPPANPTPTEPIIANQGVAQAHPKPAASPAPADTAAPIQAAATDTAAPSPTAAPLGPYKDGEYTGPEVDAFYGLVQVKAVIQNGQMADVQFLEYPSDRRTSIRINNVAVPYLRSEAMQAQNANVDIVSGATLTSEGFIMSLQSALSSARR